MKTRSGQSLIKPWENQEWGLGTKAFLDSGATHKEAIPERICLLEMGHPQQATPLKLDNTTAQGILTKTLIPKRSKSIDMRFFWLRDRNNQDQFNIYWNKGSENIADYFTKHHPAVHRKKMRRLLMSSCLIGTININQKIISSLS